MILKIALIALYLVIGLWLFVAAVSYMGGLSQLPAYQNKIILITSTILVMIFWPMFILKDFFRRRK